MLQVLGSKVCLPQTYDIGLHLSLVSQYVKLLIYFDGIDKTHREKECYTESEANNFSEEIDVIIDVYVLNTSQKFVSMTFI